jgi:hypothetical protein
MEGRQTKSGSVIKTGVGVSEEKEYVLNNRYEWVPQNKLHVPPPLEATDD